MANDSYDNDRFDEAFCREIVEKVPAIAPLLKEHLKDQDGELLSYLFMSAVAEWAEKNVEAGTLM